MRSLSILLTAAVLAPAQAHAQEEFSVLWHTIDCGGGQATSIDFEVLASIAQPDAGVMFGPESGESFSITGGFWIDGAFCYPNCDGSSLQPTLTANDFQCFLNKFAANDLSANCDNSTVFPSLTANDFTCFLNAYVAGCP